MEMKKCKECGKLFMPKSTRSQYCDDLHYRPCPACGKPVEAKYLSDPPRCCSRTCSRQLNNSSSSSHSSTAEKPQSSSIQSSIQSQAISYPKIDDIPLDLSEPVLIWGSGAECDEVERLLDVEDKLRARCICRQYLGSHRARLTKYHEYAIRIVRETQKSLKARVLYDFTLGKVCRFDIELQSRQMFDTIFTEYTGEELADAE